MEADTTPVSTPPSSTSTSSLEIYVDESVNFSSASADNADDRFYEPHYPSNIPVSKEEKFVHINNNNYATFEEEVLRLERRANLKNAKEFLQVIEEDVERFYKNYQRIKNGVLSDKNYEHLQELNRDVNVIADAFKFLKVMEQGYKLLNNK